MNIDLYYSCFQKMFWEKEESPLMKLAMRRDAYRTEVLAV